MLVFLVPKKYTHVDVLTHRKLYTNANSPFSCTSAPFIYLFRQFLRNSPDTYFLSKFDMFLAYIMFIIFCERVYYTASYNVL